MRILGVIALSVMIAFWRCVRKGSQSDEFIEKKLERPDLIQMKTRR